MYYTKEQLKSLLRKMGLRSGMNVLLDASGDFSNFIQEERAILDAVKEIVGYDATILVASYTPYLVNHYSRDILLEYEDMENIDFSHNIFEVKKSLPNNKLAQQLLMYDDVLRSHHPAYSMIGWGKFAKMIVSQHPLHFSRSHNSPIDKLFALNAFYLSFNQTQNTFFDYVASTNNVGTVKVEVVSIIDKAIKVEKPLLEYEIDRSKYHFIKETLIEQQLASVESIGDHELMFCSMNKTYPLIQLLLVK